MVQIGQLQYNTQVFVAAVPAAAVQPLADGHIVRRPVTDGRVEDGADGVAAAGHGSRVVEQCVLHHGRQTFQQKAVNGLLLLLRVEHHQTVGGLAVFFDIDTHAAAHLLFRVEVEPAVQLPHGLIFAAVLQGGQHIVGVLGGAEHAPGHAVGFALHRGNHRKIHADNHQRLAQQVVAQLQQCLDGLALEPGVAEVAVPAVVAVEHRLNGVVHGGGGGRVYHSLPPPRGAAAHSEHQSRPVGGGAPVLPGRRHTEGPFGGSGALFQQLGPGQNRLHRQGAVDGHGIQLGELPAQQSGAEFHGHDLPDNTKIAPEYDAEVFLFFIIHIVGKIMMICQ